MRYHSGVLQKKFLAITQPILSALQSQKRSSVSGLSIRLVFISQVSQPFLNSSIETHTVLCTKKCCAACHIGIITTRLYSVNLHIRGALLQPPLWKTHNPLLTALRLANHASPPFGITLCPPYTRFCTASLPCTASIRVGTHPSASQSHAQSFHKPATTTPFFPG